MVPACCWLDNSVGVCWLVCCLSFFSLFHCSSSFWLRTPSLSRSTSENDSSSLSFLPSLLPCSISARLRLRSPSLSSFWNIFCGSFSLPSSAIAKPEPVPIAINTAVIKVLLSLFIVIPRSFLSAKRRFRRLHVLLTDRPVHRSPHGHDLPKQTPCQLEMIVWGEDGRDAASW